MLDWYRKSSHSSIYLHYMSNLSMKNEVNLVSDMKSRSRFVTTLYKIKTKNLKQYYDKKNEYSILNNTLYRENYPHSKKF